MMDYSVPTTEDVPGPAKCPFKAVNHCVCFGGEWSCLCGPTERVMRSYESGEGRCKCGVRSRPENLIHRGGSDYQCYDCLSWFQPVMPPMTEQQREWCYAEIVYCSEGATREEYVNDTDQQLASHVLFAWQDFARDKGVI